MTFLNVKNRKKISNISVWKEFSNAKDIGTLYLMFALFSGLIGTAFSVLIRLELSGPGVQYIADNQLYNSIITAHAIVMIFFMVMPALIGFVLKNRVFDSLEWCLISPPKPHSFVSLSLQSSAVSSGSANNPTGLTCPPHVWELERINVGNRVRVSETICGNAASTAYDPIRGTISPNSDHKLNDSGTRAPLAATYRRCSRCSMEICTECFKYSTLSLSFLPISSFSFLELPFIAAIIASLSLWLEVPYLEFIVFLQTLLLPYRAYKWFNRIIKFCSLLVKSYNNIKSKITISWYEIVLVLVIFLVLSSIIIISCDAPRVWGLYFQDSASSPWGCFTGYCVNTAKIKNWNFLRTLGGRTLHLKLGLKK